MKPEPPNVKPANEPPCPKCKSNNVISPYWRGVYRACPDCGHSWQTRSTERPQDPTDWTASLYDRLNSAHHQLSALLTAIRKHRDYRGDDRCWLDDQELYQSLPEGYTPPAVEVAVELHNCERFLACRRNPATQYVSPQRRIEELTRERDEAVNVLSKLCDFINREGPASKEWLPITELCERGTAIAAALAVGKEKAEPPKPHVCKFTFQTPLECGSPVSKHWNPSHGLPYCDRHQPECIKESKPD